MLYPDYSSRVFNHKEDTMDVKEIRKIRRNEAKRLNTYLDKMLERIYEKTGEEVAEIQVHICQRLKDNGSFRNEINHLMVRLNNF